MCQACRFLCFHLGRISELLSSGLEVGFRFKALEDLARGLEFKLQGFGTCLAGALGVRRASS